MSEDKQQKEKQKRSRRSLLRIEQEAEHQKWYIYRKRGVYDG